MILYTIMPYNIVFGHDNNKYNELFEIMYLGEKVLVYSLQDNKCVINRLLSTSPKTFLKPELQPGTIIKANYGKI